MQPCALVTGASSGLGDAIARELASRGHDLVLVARREDRMHALAAELDVRAEVLACDLADAEARAALPDRVAGLGLDVDILVNNAGIGSAGQFKDLDVGWETLIARVNVEAVVDLTGRFLPAMVRRGQGGLLNVASTTAFQPMAGGATYAASKAFLLSWTEALHAELAGTGVTATALCPGPVRTEIWEDGGNAASVADRLPGFLWTTPEHVARDGVDGLEAGKRVVVPGTFNRLGALGGQHVPRSVLLRIAAAFSPDE